MSLPILPEHVNHLVDVSHPTLSPDGTSLVFVRTHIQPTDMTSVSQLWRQSVPNGEPEVFTLGTKDARPRHAPNGEAIAFLRPDKRDHKQIHLIATTGGEARPCSRLPSGIHDFAWSPDGRKLVAVSRLDPDAPGEESPYPKSLVAERIRYRGDEDGWLGNAFLQLFVIDVLTGEATQITDGKGDHRSPAWSPDGAAIAYITDAVEDRDLNRRSEARVLTVLDGISHGWSGDLSRVDSLAWSPDSQQLAAVGSHDAEIWDARMSWLYVLTATAPARQLTDGLFTIVTLDLNSWTREDTILVVGDRAGESCLYGVPSSGKRPTVIAGGDQTFTGMAISDSQVILQSHSTASPGDLLAVTVDNKTLIPLTYFNRDFFSQHPAVRFEKFTFTRGGLEIQARVFLPFDFDETKKYPLVLEIHGGPNGRYSDAFDITHQVLAGAGYIVLAVNPRGSSSYGPDFVKAVLCDWGGEDFLDLMTAVDILCERPYVDSGRLGVHGYSYGGFMSSWIVGHDHRFKAAVVGAPCINLHSMYGTSDIGVSFGENQWGGSSVGDREILLKHSPLTYASDVQTPVLLMHGEVDYRCPIEQSEQFFVALKRQDKPVAFVRFPGGAHGFRKNAHPVFREEYLRRMIDWLGCYV
ncbi:MAG: S9 family peptidase [bacterium]|nr:S9 family peptidase [bacterium]